MNTKKQQSRQQALDEFTPQLFKCFRDYSVERFTKDLMAGIIVGIVALPLAIAFGIASGVSPEVGLTTAIIGGFIVSFLGGVRYRSEAPRERSLSLYMASSNNTASEGWPLLPSWRD